MGQIEEDDAEHEDAMYKLPSDSDTASLVPILLNLISLIMEFDPKSK